MSLKDLYLGLQLITLVLHWKLRTYIIIIIIVFINYPIHTYTLTFCIEIVTVININENLIIRQDVTVIRFCSLHCRPFTPLAMGKVRKTQKISHHFIYYIIFFVIKQLYLFKH